MVEDLRRFLLLDSYQLDTYNYHSPSLSYPNTQKHWKLNNSNKSHSYPNNYFSIDSPSGPNGPNGTSSLNNYHMGYKY